MIGAILKGLRKARGLNQKEAAKKLDISNVALSNIENGHSIPSIENLQKIVNTHDCTLTISIKGKTEKGDDINISIDL